jgi:hypothetical protein
MRRELIRRPEPTIGRGRRRRHLRSQTPLRLRRFTAFINNNILAKKVYFIKAQYWIKGTNTGPLLQ